MCLNIDGGMYGGGHGFVYRLPALNPKASPKPFSNPKTLK
jgi:hypothetical protein